MSEKINSNDLYTTTDAQNFLKVSKSTLKRYLKSGLIKANKVGGRYKIWGKELLRLVSPEAEEKGTNLYQKAKTKVKNKIEQW